MSRILRTSAVVIATTALLAGTTGLAQSAGAATSRHTLPGSVPSWATAAHRTASSSTSTPVEFRVYLDWTGDPASYATAVSTPGSASYHQFLTPAQFASRYAPSASTVNAVKTWLRQQGFTVGHVPGNSKYVEASGTLGQAATAFQTSFAEYSVQGTTLRSNTSHS